MTEIKKWGGKRVKAGRTYKGYTQFTNARLEPGIIEWLQSEKQRHPSWNIFFRELKKRYESHGRGNPPHQEKE